MNTWHLKIFAMRCLGKLVAVVFLFAISGCTKKDYSDPKDFLAKYLNEIIREDIFSRRWLNAMELKGLEVENARLEPYYGMTAVCADLRLVRQSDKTVYMYSSSSSRLPGKILTKEEADERFKAEAKIRRVKLDTGVFAPESKSFTDNIQGFGLLGDMRVADLSQIRRLAAKTIREAEDKIDFCKDGVAMENIFRQLVRLAVNRHLDYVEDKDALQQYFNALDKCLLAAANMKKGYTPVLVIAKEDMATFNEMCRKKGMQTPRERMMAALSKADFDVASAAARLVLASDRDNPNAHFALGMWHYTNKHWGDAERHLQRCKEKHPKDVAVWNNLAVTYL